MRDLPKQRLPLVFGNLAQVPLVMNGANGPISVPLGQIATLTSGFAPARIDHLDRNRVISVEANVDPGEPLSAANAGIEVVAANRTAKQALRIMNGTPAPQMPVFSSKSGVCMVRRGNIPAMGPDLKRYSRSP